MGEAPREQALSNLAAGSAWYRLGHQSLAAQHGRSYPGKKESHLRFDGGHTAP